MKKEDLSKAICISTNTTLETGGYYYIDAREISTTYTKDGVPYVDVYSPNYEWLGMAPRRAFYLLKTEYQAKGILCYLRGMYPGTETLYEDVIVSEVGEENLYALRQYHMIETCGNFNGRKLYAI